MLLYLLPCDRYSQMSAGDSDVGYIAGKQLSMADIAVFPHLAWSVRFGLQLEPKFSTYGSLLPEDVAATFCKENVAATLGRNGMSYEDFC